MILIGYSAIAFIYRRTYLQCDRWDTRTRTCGFELVSLDLSTIWHNTYQWGFECVSWVLKIINASTFTHSTMVSRCCHQEDDTQTCGSGPVSLSLGTIRYNAYRWEFECVSCLVKTTKTSTFMHRTKRPRCHRRDVNTQTSTYGSIHQSDYSSE